MQKTLDELKVIPLGQLQPNPANRPLQRIQIEEMKQSLGSVGQLQPIKVAPLPDGGYRIIGGHIRYNAASELGWDSLNALVRPVEAGNIALEAAMDNRFSGMFWLDWYQEINKVAVERPELSQRQLAAVLGEEHTEVCRAMKTMRLMKPGTAKAISQARARGAYDMPARCMHKVLAVAESGTEEDKAKVEEAVETVLERKMTHAQAEQLVKWMRSGNRAQDLPIGGPVALPIAKESPVVSGAKSALANAWSSYFTPDRVWKMFWSLLTMAFLFAALKWAGKSSMQVYVKDLPHNPEITIHPHKGDIRQ